MVRCEGCTSAQDLLTINMPGSGEIGPKLPDTRLICSRVLAKSPPTTFEETPNHSTKFTKDPAMNK